MKIQNKYAFTLVELIVVITILAILGTIAFISLQGYSAQSRDSKRLSDIVNIKKSLELFSLNTGKYPEPDFPVEYSFSGELLWTQGIVGNQVTTNLSRNLQDKPLDPSQETEYVYSVINTQTQYELLASFETNDLVEINYLSQPSIALAKESSVLNLLNNTFATEYSPKICGTYNGIYVKSSSFIFPTPSIINALNVETDFNENGEAIQSQIISGGDNNIDGGTGALSDLIVAYTGVINDDSSDAEKISVIDMLQSFYSGTSISNIDEIANLLSVSTYDEKKDLVEFLILNNGNFVTSNQIDESLSLSGNDEYTKLLVHADGDDSLNNNQLINNGIITYTSDSPFGTGNSMFFNGIGNKITSPSNTSFDIGTGDFTVEGWLKTTTLLGNKVWFSIGNLNSGDGTMMLFQSADGIQAYFKNSLGYQEYLINKIDVIEANTWYHVAFVRSSGVITVYLNGNIIQSANYSDELNYNNGILSIGSQSNNSYPFPGNISEVRFSNIARYTTESFSVPTESFVTDNNTILLVHGNGDVSSSFHDLTFNGGVKIDSNISNSSSFKGSYYFDGVDDFISIPDSEDFDFGSEDFTIDFWFKTTSWQTAYIYSKRTNGATYGHMVIGTTTNGLILRATSSSNSSWDIIDNFTLASNLDLNVWYHFALVRKNSVWKSYINGIQTSSFTNSNPINITNELVRIGGESSSYRFNGYIDEFRISKGIARTEDSNDYMYDLEGDGFTPPTLPYGN